MKQKIERTTLDAAVRAAEDKPAAIRREGQIPAVVYKDGKGAASIQVPARELSRILHTKAGENALITLKFSGDKAPVAADNVVLIKELQHHPVTNAMLHVDFHQISLTKKITVSVPVTFKGESIGVKQNGGVLEHLRWDLEVECLPTEIPAEIPVDISGLDLGQTLQVKDIPMPEGVRAVTDEHQPLVACMEPQREEAAAPAEEGTPTEPEVIKQKKPEEEGAAAPAEGKEKGKAEPKAEAKKA